MIVFYLNFHRRRPISTTLMIVQSRTLDVDLRCRDFVADLIGGTTTLALRAAAAIVDRERVIGCVCRDARDIALNLIDKINSRLRVVSIPVGQSRSDDDTQSIDAERSFFQPRLPRPPCLNAAHSPSPTMDSPVLSTMRWIRPLIGTRRTAKSRRGLRRESVVRSGVSRSTPINTRPQESLRLTKWQLEDKP